MSTMRDAIAILVPFLAACTAHTTAAATAPVLPRPSEAAIISRRQNRSVEIVIRGN